MPMRNVIDPGARMVLTAEVVPAGRLLFSGSALVYALCALVYLVAAPVEPHRPLALIFILVGSFFGGFSMGLIFVTAMIVLFCGWILYDTSNVLHHYHTSQHVAASLALFSSLTTLFWYVIRLMSILNSDD